MWSAWWYLLYDDVSYVNTDTKVEILCNIHGKFMKTPYKHLKGQGCKSCSSKIKSDRNRHTTIKFIERSNLVHNYKYKYDNTKYI